MKKFLLFFCLLFVNIALFADKPSIGIFTYQVYGAAPWDPDSIHSGITGSEEAVIYVSQKLAALGYEVLVFGTAPENSPHKSAESNPRYVPLDHTQDQPLDVAISWRMPTIAKKLKALAKKIYLWPHDTFSYPLLKEEIEKFDDVLWLSNWQREQWSSINPPFKAFHKIFGNGVNPEQFAPLQNKKNPYSCIYGSNYARGLEILLDIWPRVRERFPKATLDIYYGWQHWGLLSAQKEAEMRVKVAGLSPFGVTEHGLVSHEELNKAFAEASFWTYPCTAPEVFCITALRAQLSGAYPVIIEGSALPETVANGFKSPSSEKYLTTLLEAFSKAEKITLNDRQKNADFVLQNYTWEKIAQRWHELFSSNLSK
jgi:glycosyltransferase involved in cell wall biosynthesis